MFYSEDKALQFKNFKFLNSGQYTKCNRDCRLNEYCYAISASFDEWALCNGNDISSPDNDGALAIGHKIVHHWWKKVE